MLSSLKDFAYAVQFAPCAFHLALNLFRAVLIVSATPLRLASLCCASTCPRLVPSPTTVTAVRALVRRRLRLGRNSGLTLFDFLWSYINLRLRGLSCLRHSRRSSSRGVGGLLLYGSRVLVRVIPEIVECYCAGSAY